MASDMIRKAVLVVADVADHIARDLRNYLAIGHRVVAIPGEERRLSATFSGDDDLVGGAERFTPEPGIHQTVVGDPKLDVVFEESIEDGVRNLVADLVGMAFRYGFAGEEIIDM